MNTSTSEYSSGCESGWTIYFDQLSSYTDPYNRACVTNCEGKRGYNLNEDEDDDEDLSMVSDASSGPPNLENEVHYYDYMPSVSEDKKKNKCKSKTRDNFSKQQQQQQSVCLDDTASSPIFHLSQDNAPPYDDRDNNVFSAADFQDESTTKKHFGFFTSSKQKSGSLLGRKRQ